jgi:hypothetical protein
VQERLEVLVTPELLARGVAAWCGAERRSSPPAPTAGHVRHVAAVEVGLRIAPHVGELSARLEASDDTVVLVAVFREVVNTVQKHIRILRLIERKMNTVRSNGYVP